MATQSHIFTWRIPWTEEPGRIYSPWGRMTLPNYEPLAMSATPKAAGGELALRKGQPQSVGGSQDPHGFCRGECSGPVGSIASHLVAEVDAGTWLFQ